MKIEPVYFVWIPGLRGPEGQIWYGNKTDGNGKEKPTLAKHKLSRIEQTISLDGLKKLYPHGIPD